MFVCLCSGNFRPTLRELLCGLYVRSERVYVPAGDGFLRVRVRGGRQAEAQLAAIVRTCGGVLLAPQGFSLSAALRRMLFIPNAFWLHVAIRTLECVLRSGKIPPAKLSVALEDPAGILAQCAGCLLPYCAEMRVYTCDTAAYDHLALTSWRQCGATLTVRDSPDLLAECALRLSAQGWSLHGVQFRPAGVCMPAQYAAFVPPEIDPDLFAAALYECGHVHALSVCAARGTLIDGNYRSLAETVSDMQKFF